mmetsp:Transcript_11393/g.17941  ORF Transcript_11393/g.17941 Transcript_11393/m.17941 type:complete len:193 (-) Transcript_11393:731-1309(-)
MADRCPLCGATCSEPQVCPSCGSLEGLEDEDVPRARPCIFLDIDGVLNTSSSPSEALEMGILKGFAKVVSATGATVVLSSTWRIHDRLVQKFQQAMMQSGVSISIEKTPILNWERWDEMRGEETCLNRCNEIMAWLDEPGNRTRFSTWIAVDDLPLSVVDPARFQGKHVHTDPEKGLTPEQCVTCVQLLNSE